MKNQHPPSPKTIKEFCAILADICETDDMYRFLESILTPKELIDIDLRWQLTKMLADGKTQRSIADELSVSLCKITRGAKELKKKNSILQRMIAKHYPHLKGANE